MKFWFGCLLMVILTVNSSASLAAGPLDGLMVMCYHDVPESLRGNNDPLAIDAGELVGQFAWLKENGYTPVSVRQILDAQRGVKALPAKPVLLTFDDGFRSFYTNVYPLLRMFEFPALFALVGRWMEEKDFSATPRYVSWDEVREMTGSGWVEIASHSYDLHRGVPGNPQGNSTPAAVTFQYDAISARYETEAAYEARVREDLARNLQLIQARVGVRPVVMVWPYGQYNRTTLRIARELGMPLSLNLDDPRAARRGDDLDLPRVLVKDRPDLQRFVASVTSGYPLDPVRGVQVDLDYVFDVDPSRQEANLSRLIDRIAALGVNTVYLQAFADPDGDGVADSVYFPSRHLPMRADLFNRVSWQLRTRAGVKVLAWMPLLAFKLPREHPSANDLVARAQPASGRTHRLSPFSAKARRTVVEIYADLARHAPFDGLLFHDDATLDDHEDASPSALAYYGERWGLPRDIASLRANRAIAADWSRKKTRHLIEFTHEIARTVMQHRAPLRLARNLYARPVMVPDAQAWFAQSFPDFAASYDEVLLMAMPYLERATDPQRWMQDLVHAVSTHGKGKARIVFELQTRNWLTGRALPSAEVANTVRNLLLQGIQDIAYYPDDFFGDRPQLDVLQPEMSLQGEAR